MQHLCMIFRLVQFISEGLLCPARKAWTGAWFYGNTVYKRQGGEGHRTATQRRHGHQIRLENPAQALEYRLSDVVRQAISPCAKGGIKYPMARELLRLPYCY